MEGLLFFWVYPSEGFRFILIPDGNLSHEFPVLDGNPSSNMNSANELGYAYSKLRSRRQQVKHLSQLRRRKPYKRFQQLSYKIM